MQPVYPGSHPYPFPPGDLARGFPNFVPVGRNPPGGYPRGGRGGAPPVRGGRGFPPPPMPDSRHVRGPPFRGDVPPPGPRGMYADFDPSKPWSMPPMYYPPPDMRGYPAPFPSQPMSKKRSDQIPNTSVMFRGLNLNTTEDTIKDYVKPFGSVNSVKVIIDRATGVSRGIAFVEFQQLSAAKAFYDHYKQPDQPNSHKILIDGNQVDLKYSRPQNSSRGPVSILPPPPIPDWYMRDARMPLPMGPPPICTLSILNLNANTTKQTLIDVFQRYSPIKSCRLLWDKTRDVSRGMAFIEFYSVEETNLVLSQTHNLVIDGSTVRVSFARHNNSDQVRGPTDSDDSLLPSSSSSSQSQQQSSQQQVQPSGSTHNYQPQSSNNPQGENDLTHSQEQSQPEFEEQIEDNYYLTTIPNHEDFVLDKISGFYWNAKLNLYFDSKTHYFYNVVDKKYYIFDQDKQDFQETIVPSPLPSSSDEKSAEQANNEASGEVAGENDTPTPSSSSPNDTQLESTPPAVASQVESEVSPQPIPHLPASSSVPLDQVSSSEDEPSASLLPAPPAASLSHPAPVLPQSGSSPALEEIRGAYENTTGVVCNLCKRKLPSNQALLKHNSLSDLHRANLEALIVAKSEATNPSTPATSQPIENPTSAEEEIVQEVTNESAKRVVRDFATETTDTKRPKLE